MSASPIAARPDAEGSSWSRWPSWSPPGSAPCRWSCRPMPWHPRTSPTACCPPVTAGPRAVRAPPAAPRSTAPCRPPSTPPPRATPSSTGPLRHRPVPAVLPPPLRRRRLRLRLRQRHRRLRPRQHHPARPGRRGRRTGRIPRRAAHGPRRRNRSEPAPAGPGPGRGPHRPRLPGRHRRLEPDGLMGGTVRTRTGRTRTSERTIERTATLRHLPDNAPVAPRGRTEAMTEDEAAADVHAFFERHHARTWPPSWTYGPRWTRCRSANAPAWYCGTPSTSRRRTPRRRSGYRWVR